MIENLRFIVSAKFGLIILLFFFPFLTVSCSDVMDVQLSGMDMAFGETIEMKQPFTDDVLEEDVEPNPLVTVVLGLAIAGLAFAIFQSKFVAQVSVVLGGAGMALLLLIQNRTTEEIVKESSGLASANFEPGFWLTLLLFAAISLTSLFAIVSKK